ncbi:MAG TPA: GldG family protein [Terriglobales bacterium]|nr:GldG family protein [Terriglobales bacterium]
MAEQDPNLKPSRPNWLVQRGSLVAYLLVALAVLVAVNVLASQHDRSWDTTKAHTHSLDPESVKIVQGLRQPLHFIYFDRSDNFPAAREFFGRYQRESNKVAVDYVDPDRHPDQAKQYKIQNYGSIVVASGGHQEIVTNMAEQDVTNAMVRVLKGARKVVYFAEGDGERDPDDSGRTGYSELKSALEAENFTVQKLVLAQSPKVPADCAVLIVAGPAHALLQPEVQAIQDYITGGGHALFMIGPDSNGPLVNYLQTGLNVKLTPGVVIDTSGIGQLFGASAVMPIAAQYDPHPITAQMSGAATLFPYARTVDPGAVPGAKAVVSPLLETTGRSFVTPSIASGQVQESPTDRHGPLPLGAAGTLATTSANPSDAGDSAEARFVVYGSPDFVSNSILSFQGNRDLFLNTMDWLSTQQNFITIRPKAPTNTPVNLSAAQMRMIVYTFLLGLPLAVVIIGVGVWWRRRAL